VIDPCRYCSSERVAAVIDKRIEASPTAGNKYRTRCLGCGRWLPCCSAADFQTADHQHVLPRDADPDAEDPTVPAEEFDGAVDGVSGATDDSPDVATDGGQPVDDDRDENDDAHRFECPKCEGSVEGYPDECPHCEVGYNWPDEAESGGEH
jgi:hypothetical protein